MVSEDNYLGLTRPLYLTCNLCKNQYDAVIMMETYTEDSRYSWLVDTQIYLDMFQKAVD